MRAFIAWLYTFAVGLGGPGLLAVAFLDSSFVPLPQINDLLVVLMVTQNKALMPYYAAMATLVLNPWPRVGGKLDLDKSPFRLAAIVHALDESGVNLGQSLLRTGDPLYHLLQLGVGVGRFAGEVTHDAHYVIARRHCLTLRVAGSFGRGSVIRAELPGTSFANTTSLVEPTRSNRLTVPKS